MFGHRYFGRALFGPGWFGPAGALTQAVAAGRARYLRLPAAAQRLVLAAVPENDEFGTPSARQSAPPAKRAQAMPMVEAEEYGVAVARSVFATRARTDHDDYVAGVLRARRGCPSHAFLTEFLNSIA